MSKRLPAQIREARPLVHAITNYVTMDWVARGLLAVGARPFMALDRSEAGAVAAKADALLLNMGTWTPEFMEAALVAGKAANASGVPVVLDPVGAGGLESRTAIARELLESVRFAAVRGNAGEIAALAGESGLVRGVDTRSLSLEATAAAALRVARRYGCVAAATGPVDIVSDGTKTLVIRAGHPLMAEIPGAGCLASGIVAAAVGARVPGLSPLEAVAQALLLTGVAGEVAAGEAKGPGSFATGYLDALATAESLPEGRIAPPLWDLLSLYVIVSGTTPLTTLQAILDAGVRIIQFREKQMDLPAQVEIAAQMRALCREKGALFLVNDRVDLALAAGADGVHLGQEDLPVAAARRILGPEAIIGASCETADEARIATEQGADYIGSGPVYATPSKADAGEPYGPAVISRVRAATHLPVVGIGGIGPGGAAPVIAAGGAGVAVISSVVGAADPGAAAHALLLEVQTAKEAALA